MLGLVSPVAAQEDNPAPPLSRTCGVPLSSLVAPAPLTRLAAAIERRTTIHVLAIGSSSTVGIGASTPDRNYPVQLQTILERTPRSHDVYISSSGVSGELAAARAERIKNEVKLKQPDLVLWQVGTNDALAGVPVEAFRATLSGTIRWLKEHQTDTALIGLQYSPAVARNERHRAIGRAISEVAAEENVLLIRRYDAMQFLANSKWENLLSDDGLHHNDLGYCCMAEHVARAVIVSAFPPRRGGPKPDGDVAQAQPR